MLQLDGAGIDRLEIHNAYNSIDRPKLMHVPLMQTTNQSRCMDTLQAAQQSLMRREPVLWCPGKRGMGPMESAFLN